MADIHDILQHVSDGRLSCIIWHPHLFPLSQLLKGHIFMGSCSHNDFGLLLCFAVFISTIGRIWIFSFVSFHFWKAKWPSRVRALFIWLAGFNTVVFDFFVMKLLRLAFVPFLLLVLVFPLKYKGANDLRQTKHLCHQGWSLHTTT